MYSSKKWDKIYLQGYLASYPDTTIVSFIFRTFGKNSPQTKNIRILDLGCGGGNNTWFLAREGFTTYAFDGSSKAINLAKEKLIKEGLSANFKQGNFINLPYKDNFFDAVIDDYAVEANNVSDINKTFCEINKKLKHGGKYFGLMLSSYNREMMKGKLIEKRTYDRTPEKDRIMHFSTKKEINTWLKNACFSKAEINYRIISYKNSKSLEHSWLIEATK
jgi:ubiquinone/menaquinone biosynthesis C-methylase UbiE